MFGLNKSVHKPRILVLILCLMMLLTVAVTAASAEDTVSEENLFNKKDPYFSIGYNFVQSTSRITNEEDSFITGYIPVTAGKTVLINLNSPKNSSFIKYALFNKDKKWIDTVKTNNISELTVRIFEDGYIRVSVFGRQFINSITIYMAADTQRPESEFEDTVLTTADHTNVLVQTTENKDETYVDRFDRNDPDYLDKKNYVQYTSEIVDEGNSFITGFIPVNKGDTVILSLNSNRNSAFIKYALYDKSKTWKKTARFNHTSEVIASITDPGFIRFSVNGRLFKNTTTIYVHPAIMLTADQKIGDTIMPALANNQSFMESFDQNYMSEESVELFDRSTLTMDKGFSQLTDVIVDDEGSFLTDYIPVAGSQFVIVQISAQSEFAKYALYDKDKNWIRTYRVNNPTDMIIDVQEAGYLRFHGKGKALDATSITVPYLKKLSLASLEGDVGTRLTRLESVTNVKNEVDLVIFMGQSNMAGRGEVTAEHPEDAPAVIQGAGWEFKAISKPTELFEIDKTFGFDENVAGAIDDGHHKTGGMVPAFVNAYYKNNGNVPVICVSASEGATSIADWLPGTPRLTDAINRLNTAVNWLENNGYDIRHKYVLWCQGEGDVGKPEQQYAGYFNVMFNALKTAGIEKLFMVRIGNSNPVNQARVDMMRYQNNICQNSNDIVMVSTDLAAMQSRGLMKDVDHYYQQAYNECGEHAGINMAYYVTIGKEPMMYDTQFNELYMSKVN